ncbi:DUF523 domain-containing protein [Paraburkholderia sp. CNPSo 3272]|uniref:DUF523 domain-containing protein n=1 Tax=Paraburkholderia sp. CNPSo 3272 TaxID=2940931 RepID=UPI0020B84F01|nr:DUF523 domain-containing protein [Paraburkholderia sp. CNPSo 3272]MCP3722620.1 DUF523 domain-containing protein [Paraburkholderia sp. CNPSo 3272]
MLPRILVSACLLGRPVRYDGSAKTVAHALIEQWQREGRLVPVCPEVAGGFGVPRPPAEIANAASGAAVLAGLAHVIDARGEDVSICFVEGARVALELALAHDCRYALLTDGSPSCGSRAIYDGSFAGRKHAGAGVTTALLRQHGIEVFAETEIEALHARLTQASA